MDKSLSFNKFKSSPKLKFVPRQSFNPKSDNLHVNDCGFVIKSELFNNLKIKKNEFVINHNIFKKVNQSDYVFERDFDCLLSSKWNKYLGMLKGKGDSLQKSGVGIYFYPTKDIYFGEWVNDEKEGSGIYIEKNKEYSDKDKANISSSDKEAFKIIMGTINHSSFSGDGIIIDFVNFDSNSYDDSIFNAYIGHLVDNKFISGLSITKRQSDYIIYNGKYENGLRTDEHALYYQSSNDTLFYGEITDNIPINGFLVSFTENYDDYTKVYKIKDGLYENELVNKEFKLTEDSDLIFKFITFITEDKKYYRLSPEDKSCYENNILSVIHHYTVNLIDYLNKAYNLKRSICLDSLKIKDFLCSFNELIKNNLFDNENIKEEKSDSEEGVALGLSND